MEKAGSLRSCIFLSFYLHSSRTSHLRSQIGIRSCTSDHCEWLLQSVGVNTLLFYASAHTLTRTVASLCTLVTRTYLHWVEATVNALPMYSEMHAIRRKGETQKQQKSIKKNSFSTPLWSFVSNRFNRFFLYKHLLFTSEYEQNRTRERNWERKKYHLLKQLKYPFFLLLVGLFYS